MDCKEICELLTAHVDHELSVREALDVDAHLQGCPACQAEYAQQTAMRAAVKKHATYFAAPADVARQIQHALPTSTAPVRRTWQWTHTGALMATVVAIAWSLGLYLTLPTATDRLTDEVVANHVRSLMPDHVVDVASSDRHTVKPWFNGKLDFSPPVHDLATEGFPLIGGRLDYLDHRPVAALVYRYRQHTINLFVAPAMEAKDIPPRSASRQGYHVVYWTQAGMSYRAVSDVAPAQLDRFKDFILARPHNDRVTGT